MLSATFSFFPPCHSTMKSKRLWEGMRWLSVAIFSGCSGERLQTGRQPDSCSGNESYCVSWLQGSAVWATSFLCWNSWERFICSQGDYSCESREIDATENFRIKLKNPERYISNEPGKSRRKWLFHRCRKYSWSVQISNIAAKISGIAFTQKSGLPL